MTRSFITRCAALGLAAALTLGGLVVHAQASSDAPVVLIALENHSFGPTDPSVNGNTKRYIVGNTADAPYINNTLIPSATLFTNYDANYHPSLPDYLEFTAGTQAGCQTQCSRDSIPDENLFHLLGEAGDPFVSLLESMPGNCAFDNAPPYQVTHNPEPYFTDIDARTGSPYDCVGTDRTIPRASPGTPAAWPDPLPDFTYMAPDYCDDMHGSVPKGECPRNTDAIIAAGDAWLSTNVPALLAEGAIVIVTFDEGAEDDDTGRGGHVPTIMVGPGVNPGGTDATPYDHAGLLAGLEDYFGLTPLLVDATTATPLPIPRLTPYAVPTISGLSPENGGEGDIVTIAGAGLTNAYEVSFGGVAAPFSADSDSSITATVPSGAPTGPVTVSTMGGSATSPDTFTVDPSSSPPPALVQHVVASGTKATKASATLVQPTVAGDLLVATIGWTGAGKVTAPAGWTLATSSGDTAIFYRQDAPSLSGPTTFSVSAKSNWVLCVSEWNGIATSGPLDRTAWASSANTKSTTATSGSTGVTSQPVELVIGGIRGAAKLAESAPTHGFVQLDQRIAGGNTLGAFDLVTVVAGTQSTSVTLSILSNWRGVIASFRGA